MAASTNTPAQRVKSEDSHPDYAAVNTFTSVNIAELYASQFAQGYGSKKRQAAIRALLRHGVHQDGTHYHTKTQDGLHPAYAMFNPIGKTDQKVLGRTELVEASLGDLFDAITMQDRLDGGISLLLRCPGFDNSDGLTADKISVDVYVTPRELIRNERVSGDTAMLVQAFCEEFVVPYMQRFTDRCKVESIQAPNPRLPAEPITLKGPNHLPCFPNPLVARLQCTALSPDARLDITNDTRNLSASAAIRESALTSPSTNKVAPPSTGGLATLRQRPTRQRRHADAFQYAPSEKFLDPIPLVFPPDASIPRQALVSIGQNSDAVLDRFNLGDDMLPFLNILIGTVRSSRWEAALRSPPWNLSYEQAANLAGALTADLKGTAFSVTAKPKFPILSTAFRVLGIAITLCVLSLLVLLLLSL